MGKCHTSISILCGAVLLFSVSNVSADFVGTLNLYANGGKYWFNSDRLNGTPFHGLTLQDTTGGGGGLGFNMTNYWAMEGVVDYFIVGVDDFPEKLEIYNYHLDLLYQFGGQFCGDFCWQPYVAFGVGEMRINYDKAPKKRYRRYYTDEDGIERYDCKYRYKHGYKYPDWHPYRRYLCNWHDRQTMVNLGLGIKYSLGPRWQARADVRLFQGVDHGGLDGFASVAIGYQWIEYPDFWYDEDADGIIDATDQCPQTPVGVDVGPDGCPMDIDFDGVPAYIDQCPNTPVGTAVDEYGCIRR
ncbi:outer membrane beta-barrel protein [Microbulbifer variabilis]|jgi:OOP family OmpA-OmpF porin|uniref:Outer membrane beta-barrel protein n=1 Tax=Microbulbifer variabilis TaxID=266805 RepID=A0ABY4VG65_9GAMM|nr:outer membrane beta-barrel protein [Microbulbifer variabilis]USD21452.1 outer membrane beta-barrel protein [Microbulbifer variabilis]